MKISKKLNNFLSSGRIWLKPVSNDLLLFSEQRLLAHFSGFSLLPGKKLGKNPGKLGKMKISKKLNSFLSSSRIWLKPVPNDLLLFSEQRLLAHFPGFSLLPGKNLGKIRENWEKWKFRKNWITFFLVVGFSWNRSQTISYCFMNNVCWLIFQVSPCFPGKNLGKIPENTKNENFEKNWITFFLVVGFGWNRFQNDSL